MSEFNKQMLTNEDSLTASAADLSGYSYSGDNKVIENYSQGEKIFYQTDFTGIGFTDTDFSVNSSSGTLTIQNARDKVIDVSDSAGNTIAYAFLASGGGEINGGGASQLEVIIGANGNSNQITAGSGGSTLWGGAGDVQDIFIGGNGADNFFVGKGDGSDFITNAGENDTVLLYDVSLSDIVDFSPIANTISLTLNSGSTLFIDDSAGLSPTFQLADGSRWQFNHSSNSWQGA